MKKNFIVIFYFLAAIFLGIMLVVALGRTHEFSLFWGIDNNSFGILYLVSIIILIPIGLLINVLGTEKKEKNIGIVIISIPIAWILYGLFFVLN